MKKKFAILLATLMLLAAFAGFTTANAESKTMQDWLNDWQANGYPDDVAYVFPAEQAAPSSEAEDQRVHTTWEIGIVGGSETSMNALKESVPETDELVFIDCAYSYNRRTEVEAELLAVLKADSLLVDVTMPLNSDTVEVIVFDDAYDGYVREYAEKYGALVTVRRQSDVALDDDSVMTYGVDTAVVIGAAPDDGETMVAFADSLTEPGEAAEAGIGGDTSDADDTDKESNTALYILIVVAAVAVTVIVVLVVRKMKKK